MNFSNFFFHYRGVISTNVPPPVTHRVEMAPVAASAPNINAIRAPKRKAPPPFVTFVARRVRGVVATDPIWKRRGAKPIPNLQLNPVIRGDIGWDEKSFGIEKLQIVDDKEWKAMHPTYFEVHPLEDVSEGVVIDPPTYPAWYTVPSMGTNVSAVLPRTSVTLLNNALRQGFGLHNLIRSMGHVVSEYSIALIHRNRRSYQQVLIVAKRRSWQGAAAIVAATQLFKSSILVSVFLVDAMDVDPKLGTQEEFEFMDAGGQVYRDPKDLAGRRFRVVVMAAEDQYSTRASNLPAYGEWLQHAVVIFVDPPVLKCSYTTALQIATKGCYNMCQKTLLLVPFLPKAHMIDSFVEMIVVDGGISEYTQRASGIKETIFPRLNGCKAVAVVPVDFTVKGSRLYFYKDGQRAPC